MADLASLILSCAIGVHPQTVQAIIQHESGGNPYAINNQVRSFYPQSLDVARRIAIEQVAAGRSTDIGLMQVNSQHLRRLGLTPEALLDPCTNIRIGTTILRQNYAQTWAKYRAEKPALLAALSMYNTGNETRGLRNGYVRKVARVAGVPVTYMQTSQGTSYGNTKAQTQLLPMVYPRTAPTGFPGTGPKAKTPPSR